jgi:hypothetical protein
MLLNIVTGFGVAKIPRDEIVVLVSSLHRVHEMGIPFVFTNQHAYPVTAEYFTDLADLDRIDWPLLQRRDFKHDPGKKERYQAEASVWKQLSAEGLIAICCHSPEVQSHIQSEIDRRGLTMKAHVQRNWYFQ